MSRNNRKFAPENELRQQKRRRRVRYPQLSPRDKLPDYLKTVYDTFAACISDKASLVDVWEKKFYPVLAKAVFEVNSIARTDEQKKEKQLMADNIKHAVKDAVAEVLNTSKDAMKDAVSEALNAPPPSWATVAARGAAVGSTPIPRHILYHYRRIFSLFNMSSQSDEPPHSTDTNGPLSEASVDDGCTQTFQVIAWEAVQVRIRDAWVLNLRPGNRRGWFWIHGFDVQRRGTGGRGLNPVWLCGHCVKKNDPKPTHLVAANTHNIEQHLASKHRVFHPDPERPTRANAKRPRNQPGLRDFMSTRKRKNEDHQDALVSRFDSDMFQRLF
ncbi:hypothetical protein E4U22_003080, partial [Claviceps purpurea]